MPRIYAAINEPSRIHGELIRKTRLGLGMNQSELAKIFGVWRETISRIECGHFDITRAYPKYKILNERMRIWAEMNKGGRKKKYCNRGTRMIRIAVPKSAAPRSSPRSRYWQPIKQLMKEQARERLHGKNTERGTVGERDKGNHLAGDHQAS